MPDVKNYEETKEKEAYREHIMQEIEEEANQYGMTVEEYAKNGYESTAIKRTKMKDTIQRYLSFGFHKRNL